MKKLLITAVIGFIIFSLPVFSAEIHQYSVNTEIFSNNTVHYKTSLLFVDYANETFSFLLLSADNIKIEGAADCKIVKKALGTEISCFMTSSGPTSIDVEYDSSESIIKKDGYVLFSDSFRMFLDTKTLSIIIKLPEGSGLKEPIENSYSPPDALKGSDGRKLILNWVKNDLKQGDRLDVSIAFEKFSIIVPFSTPIEAILAISLIVLVAFVFVYRLFLSKRYLKLVIPILKEDEKLIFNSLMKHGDGVNQKLIVKDSGYSKAKVSKVLTSLRERGIVRLERIGRSNKVYIDNKFRKKA